MQLEQSLETILIKFSHWSLKRKIREKKKNEKQEDQGLDKLLVWFSLGKSKLRHS
ncbi:hypothetical protein M0802_011353 [Mischocyttarus mexicanus]|nr:hypothetical protein M0802_011353 [Mischocyttarus mexicanus]